MGEHTVWIQGRYESAYGLLGAMARELADGFTEAGHDARLIDLAADPHPDAGVLVFFNAPVDLDAFPASLWKADGRLRAVQVFVDHPYALPVGVLDVWSRRNGLANFRMCLPCADDVHLLRMRWPGIQHAWVGHGIPRGSLCGAGAITRQAWDGKEFDVVVTGSIAPESEVRAAFGRLTPALAGMARQVVALMVADAGVGYLQALDLVMGSNSVITGEWKTGAIFWRACVTMANRIRRVRAVESLQGLRVGVFGSEAWAPVCTGTIAHAGRVGYSDIPAAFARGRVALAWGPTQFAHSYSERIMLAMGAGCAAVSDDRLLIRRDFPGLCSLYNAAEPVTARSSCDGLLADPDAAIERARRARDWVENRCLWSARVGQILAVPGTMRAVA